jgi:hypothetical protein
LLLFSSSTASHTHKNKRIKKKKKEITKKDRIKKKEKNHKNLKQSHTKQKIERRDKGKPKKEEVSKQEEEIMSGEMGRKEEGTKKQEVRNYEWGKGKERGRNGKAGGWIGFHPIEKIPKRDFLHAALVGAGLLKPKNSRGGWKLKRMRGCGAYLVVMWHRRIRCSCCCSCINFKCD